MRTSMRTDRWGICRRSFWNSAGSFLEVTLVSNYQFTPTQKCMLEVLSDENLHPAEELGKCLYDDLGRLSNVQSHVSEIRRILAVVGKTIGTHRIDGRTFYSLCRRMAPAE